MVLATAAWANLVFAGPARCSYGNQDSTCVNPIRSAPIAQPQCSTGAGWTTVSASVWQGSQWSAPQCNYQAPPTCPSGYDQQSAPVWNGSSWVGIVCAPQAPQVTQADQQQACANAAAAYGKFINPVSAFRGPQSETTNQVSNDINTQPAPMICQAPGTGFGSAAYGYWPPTNGPYDAYKIGFSTYTDPNSGKVFGGSVLLMACMLNRGSAQVVGFILSQSQNATGGPCGGGR
ncbi:hypothetical protein [Burkholderia sp. Ac-20345]|uniref:hypothetical protein n=1 Tax=Burkholderia sp. Ac-20345 TaxID=2703891 RepID=UPI00197C6EDD